MKTKFARVITLGEICRGLSGTRLDLRKKVKKATRKRAYASAPDLTKDKTLDRVVDYEGHSISL